MGQDKLEPDFSRIVAELRQNDVEFVVIGGLACIFHGSSHVTRDVDVVYARNRQNLEKMVKALKAMQAYPRGMPKGLPFLLDVRTLEMGTNFTFQTDFGDFDILGEMKGVGDYQIAASDSEQGLIGDQEVQFLSLNKLITAKRIAGRSKDIPMVDELEVIRRAREELEKGGTNE
jgi:hypothetical protein